MPTGVTKVLVKIDLGDHLQNKGELSFAFDREPNNVSKKCVQQADGTWLLSEKTRRNYGSNLYMYGNELRPANVVGKDLSYDGVRFDATAADGSLDITLTVTASGSDGLVQGIIVYGDFSALQWATEAVLDDGTTIKSDDEIWAIRWNTPAKTHTVTFKKWNRANYNACFTHFTVLPSVLEFNKSRVRHIDSLSQCTGQRDTLWYGVIWNTGSVQIYDTDGEIYDYIRDGIIEDEQMPITIEAKGRYGSTVIQHHLNGSASYIKETRMMEIQLTNKLEQWETLKYAGRALTEACSAWDLLVEVFGTAGYSESDVEAMCDSLVSVRHPVSGAETEMTVEAFFKGVTIPYPYLEESTFREAVTKFCQLGMLWCYCDDNDNIKFVSARPKLLQGEREHAYEYPKSHIYGTTNTEIFLKNKAKILEINMNFTKFSSSHRSFSFVGFEYLDDGSFGTTFDNKNDYEVTVKTDGDQTFAEFHYSLDLATKIKYVNLSAIKGVSRGRAHRISYDERFASGDYDLLGMPVKIDVVNDESASLGTPRMTLGINGRYGLMYADIIKNLSDMDDGILNVRVRCALKDSAVQNVILYMMDMDGSITCENIETKMEKKRLSI